MTHVMVDLETLGVVPGCMIVSIGAVVFDPIAGELGEGFYRAIDLKTRYGLHENPDTMAWWASPEREEARKVFTDPAAQRLDYELEAFNRYLTNWGGKDTVVWGNGADFDNSILAAAYYATMIKPGWKPYNGRCYRTIKNLAPSIVMKRVGTHHNALDDAKSQATHLMEIAHIMGLELA